MGISYWFSHVHLHRQFCQVTLQPIFEPFDAAGSGAVVSGAVCGQEFFTMRMAMRLGTLDNLSIIHNNR